ncbi:L,D-transpeptidase [Rhodanobacter glycinis]|uniref:L,D-transpeptidase n=1 Tax=Rhodanobacter glycinis TaxID=582702 RepID=A0A5B9DYN6_9GAMM|nr:L,D-transpeptidase family protein [Rhodanobacter glycinis]QEE25252.1 L,D-transpeptidase [Rhodanobacter glycinis]
MSKLKFNGAQHQLILVDRQGKVVGTWTAYNNIDSHATIQPHIPDGTYAVVDTARPHPHAADPNGPYGSYGIVRFNVPGHVGVGVHSGRANARHLPGPQHPTMGCIRTSDAAMKSIKDFMASDPLTMIVIIGNSQSSAHAGHARLGVAHVHP